MATEENYDQHAIRTMFCEVCAAPKGSPCVDARGRALPSTHYTRRHAAMLAQDKEG